MVRLCLEHTDLIKQFFENQKSYYIEDVNREVPYTSPIYASLCNKRSIIL
ncbi:MAG: hypothetical protein ACLTTH_12110 [Holdemanella porci]